ncbi:MAG: glycosyl hydrolase [Planctomycetota bacterium]
MINADMNLTPSDLLPAIERMWDVSGAKIERIEASAEARGGKTPVFTVDGVYQPQGWTEWTQGFQFGSALLQYDVADEDRFLQIGWRNTREKMHTHVSHTGVHDHGFNNLSTYGNLLRLGRAGRFDMCEDEDAFYSLALQISGAVQAGRWTKTADGGGFIHSFNGPQSLFVDTVRSCRIVALSHLLGHRPLGEQDEPIDLPRRLREHLRKTAHCNIFYGDGDDVYDTPDVRGRTVHETLWNPVSGKFRAPSTQQGYSPFSTWTRGLAWAVLGFAEQLELAGAQPDLFDDDTVKLMHKAASATCDFYLAHTPTDGVPYWDTGAPGLVHLGDWRGESSDPFNDHEPIDSSAAAIACQGLVRYGRLAGEPRYTQAGLTTLRTLLEEPYLSTSADHEGLLLHTIYHRPNGWDHVPAGSKVPNGEACMWGDYHLREAALHVQRIAGGADYRFFDCLSGGDER